MTKNFLGNLKILYLCPKHPYPCECGEDFAYDNDISELAKFKFKENIKLIFANPTNKNANIPYNDLNYTIFKSNEKNLSPLMKKIIYMFYILFAKFPGSMTKFISKDMFKEINSYNPDIVILDSIYGMAMLNRNNNYKLIYIAHNHEAKLAFDMIKLQRDIFKKIYFYFRAQKFKKLESELIKKAKVIVCISTSDYKYFSSLYPNKVKLFPHRANTGNFSWKPKVQKTLLFCGPVNHHPNLEAIEWIVNELSPVLEKDIKIKIAGKGTDKMPKGWQRKNIDFLGFVSAEELKLLYQTCSAFICPIIYGSGVKIKVTEALSYGMPVIATREALEGLDYVDIEPLIDRNNIQKTKENIEDLLNNQEELLKFSNNLIGQIKDFQAKNDISLEKIIEEVVNE